MDVIIKKMETTEEIRGKAFVHWRCWQEVYAGIVKREYLDKMTLDGFEKKAFLWLDNILVAKEDGRVIGFVGYGDHGRELPEIGEITALYLLPEYCGKGVGIRLMEAALEQMKEYPEICLWVFKENKRAIRFYHKCGFHEDGEEKTVPSLEATGIRMILRR